jgi:hypothetical protein
MEGSQQRGYLEKSTSIVYKASHLSQEVNNMRQSYLSTQK